MKVIDLLNKIANGEEVPKKIRIDHWCYKFEWKKEVNQYWDDASELSLEDVLSLDKEELNYGVQILEDEEEPKKIEKLDINDDNSLGLMINEHFDRDDKELIMAKKLNEIIDYINKGDSNE